MARSAQCACFVFGVSLHYADTFSLPRTVQMADLSSEAGEEAVSNVRKVHKPTELFVHLHGLEVKEKNLVRQTTRIKKAVASRAEDVRLSDPS